eukprot:CAMPEP_0119524892 /NCGR_PEP_ID=MMETSP1344-20130328/39764_1 /TAXON_ID=236787 /ORGANISM="Florenciella parvula, Strain CCMP2471" /LENGTH=61 /DNA_ID=CAMNT_0007563519 /DNA_START=1 /DNA_END=183 /DNA_ORIENTATION=-
MQANMPEYFPGLDIMCVLCHGEWRAKGAAAGRRSGVTKERSKPAGGRRALAAKQPSHSRAM